MTRILKKFKVRWNSGERSEPWKSKTWYIKSPACAEETVPVISRENPAAEFLGTFTDEIKSIPTNSSKKIQKHFPDHLMR